MACPVPGDCPLQEPRPFLPSQHLPLEEMGPQGTSSCPGSLGHCLSLTGSPFTSAFWLPAGALRIQPLRKEGAPGLQSGPDVLTFFIAQPLVAARVLPALPASTACILQGTRLWGRPRRLLPWALGACARWWPAPPATSLLSFPSLSGVWLSQRVQGVLCWLSARGLSDAGDVPRSQFCFTRGACTAFPPDEHRTIWKPAVFIVTVACACFPHRGTVPLSSARVSTM